MRSHHSLGWYFGLFDFVARERVSKNDLDPRVIHAHLTMVLSTSPLMWSYTALALMSFSTPVPGAVGISASLIHLLSPFLFRATHLGQVVCGVALGAGLAFQMTFSYYSGGVESCTLAWLPILPLLAGFIEGRRCLIFWSILTALAIATFFGMSVAGHSFPFLITKNGYRSALAFLLFGWLFILFCTTWVHVSMKEFSEQTLKKQGEKIDDLFRVLFHDLANSLGRINIGMTLCGREPNGEATTRGLEVIQEAQMSMIEITQNVRRMYAVSKGKAEVDLSPVLLNSSIEHLKEIFAAQLEKKKIKVEYDSEKHKGLSVIVDQVSFHNQVLGNVFSNAIKFSHPGGTIRINCWPVNHHTIALEVKDNGIGMPDVLCSTLFDLSKKTSRPGTSGEVGTGFGMHIMKSFVEMYQGQVIVESTEDFGTSIRLHLKGEWIS